MSNKPRSFRLTPRAKNDLIAIALYTHERWGKQQRNACLKSIDDCFHWLTENPLSGKHRPEIVEGYYSFQQGSHVIFYVIKGDAIDIIGIPHKSMDLEHHF